MPKHKHFSKKDVTLSFARRKTLTVLGIIGVGVSLTSFGLLGRNFTLNFTLKNIVARPLYLGGKRMKSQRNSIGRPLVLIEWWIVKKQDLRYRKKN